MLTLVPNMNGFNGLATRFLSRELFDRHLPLTPSQLATAHERAGLTVQCATYLGSINAWVATPGAAPRIRRTVYLPLLVFTRLIWALEDRGLRFRRNRITSPMVVVVAHR